MSTAQAEDLLRVEEADAWFEYLESTRNAVAYEKVEPWAWKRLSARLTAIATRRRSLGL